ncbi:MAG: 50S ribosomal protein L3 [Deltaproteobacteria bacterium]|nr:50S ribosomal protein L3 [Deltaproteobacteria bacterium]
MSLEEVICRKIGCGRLFNEDGFECPVTFLALEEAKILDFRSENKHGYNAVVVGFEPTSLTKLKKPIRGYLVKQGAEGYKRLVELKVSDSVQPKQQDVGSVVDFPDWLTVGSFVDATGFSKGRGFTGVMKRHNMSGPPATRGTHEARRNVGSIGCRKYPGKVFKGKRLPGQYGNEKVTILNLKVIQILKEDKLIALAGSVPGYKGSLLRLRRAVKKNLKT